MTWHRIDDPEKPAPRDGTAVLLVVRPPDPYRPPFVLAASFEGSWKPRYAVMGIIERCITHWMPMPDLPPPPQDGK